MWRQGITAETIATTLKNFNIDMLPQNYFRYTEIDENLAKIFEALNIDYLFDGYTLDSLKSFRSRINKNTTL